MWTLAPADDAATAGGRGAVVEPETVVLVGRAADEHLDALEAELRRRGASVARVAVDRWDGVPDVVHDESARELPCCAVICRETSAADPLAHHRERTARVSSGLAELPAHNRAFAARETEAAVLGWLDRLRASRWVNDPWIAARAQLKLRQLAAAGSVGLRTPRTLVTGDPGRVSVLAADSPLGVVHKAQGNPLVWQEEGQAGFLYTTPVSSEQLASLDGTLAYPSLFQERLDARAELRVIVVGDCAFGVRITLGRRHGVDWRRGLRDRSLRYEVEDLDDGLRTAVVDLVGRLGLSFAAVDLLEDDDGWVFLEANPPGAYRWLERGLGIPVTDALCDLVLV